MTNIAVFASGSGTNAENLIKYFSKSQIAKVALILSNRPNAYVLKRAEKLSVPWIVFNRKQFYDSNYILNKLKEFDIGFIALAGFLWLVPKYLIDAYPKRIVNIHPALLPKYGGKGMYGDNVHKAVLAAGEKVSGITIHYVNEQYDAGQVIFQTTCPVYSDDTIQSLAERIHKLEYKHYPKIIENLLRQLNHQSTIYNRPR